MPRSVIMNWMSMGASLGLTALNSTCLVIPKKRCLVNLFGTLLEMRNIPTARFGKNERNTSSGKRWGTCLLSERPDNISSLAEEKILRDETNSILGIRVTISGHHRTQAGGRSLRKSEEKFKLYTKVQTMPSCF